MQFFELIIGARFRILYALGKPVTLTKIKPRRMCVRSDDINEGHEFWMIANAVDGKGRPYSVDMTVKVMEYAG